MNAAAADDGTLQRKRNMESSWAYMCS